MRVVALLLVLGLLCSGLLSADAAQDGIVPAFEHAKQGYSKAHSSVSAQAGRSDEELRALGLLDDEKGMGVKAIGGGLVLLGLVIIGVSVWYYLRPEKAEVRASV